VFGAYGFGHFGVCADDIGPSDDDIDPMGLLIGIFRVYGVIVFRLIGILCWLIGGRLIG
jgi:hypothetical protein